MPSSAVSSPAAPSSPAPLLASSLSSATARAAKTTTTTTTTATTTSSTTNSSSSSTSSSSSSSSAFPSFFATTTNSTLTAAGNSTTANNSHSSSSSSTPSAAPSSSALSFSRSALGGFTSFISGTIAGYRTVPSSDSAAPDLPSSSSSPPRDHRSNIVNRNGSNGSGGGGAGADDNHDDDDYDIEDDYHRGTGEVTGTITSSCINLSNTILGSGMLAMPSALASVGLILGSVLIGVSAYASIFGLVLLSHCAQAVGRHSSFFQVSKITYPAAAIWFDLAIAIKCFGVSISYLVIIGDLMPKVMLAIYPTLTGYLLTKEFWITIAIFVVTPFSFAKKLDSLRYTSALALCAVVYLLLIVVGFALFPSSDMPKRPSWSEIRLVRFNSFFTTLPIFVFAFTCHQNIFSIHNELIDNTVPRVGAVVRYSIWTAFSVYQVIGIIGYLTFGNAVASNVIQMYPSGPIITGGQIALAILFLLSYPLQCHPARASLDKVISGGSHEPMSQSRYIIVTSGLLAASYVLACTVKDLSTVLSLVGATGSTAICYILPGILYYRLRENTDLPGSRRWDSMKSGAVGLAAFGIVFMVLSLSMQLSAIFGGSKDGGGGH